MPWLLATTLGSRADAREWYATSAIASGLITTSLWRAVYDDPGAGEALLGATSASSTVTVKPCSEPRHRARNPDMATQALGAPTVKPGADSGCPI